MANGASTHHREWVPGDGFREWAHRQLVEAEIEKVESKVRYTIDDVIRFGQPHFSNVLEARLAVALAGVNHSIHLRTRSGRRFRCVDRQSNRTQPSCSAQQSRGVARAISRPSTK